MRAFECEIVWRRKAAYQLYNLNVEIKAAPVQRNEEAAALSRTTRETDAFVRSFLLTIKNVKAKNFLFA